MPRLRLAPDGPGSLRIDRGDGDAVEAVLLSIPAAPDLRRAARILCAAWKGPGGSVLWDWPAADGAFAGLDTGVEATAAVLLAPALSLVDALRRAPSDFGGRFTVIGTGLARALATEVALDFGLRRASGREPGPSGGPGPGERVPLALLAPLSGPGLEEAFRAVADGGRIVALGEAEDLPAVDFYPHLHRRGLTLQLAPPAPDETSREVWERGRGRLEAIVAAACRTEEGTARVRPGWIADLAAPGYWIHAGPSAGQGRGTS